MTAPLARPPLPRPSAAAAVPGPLPDRAAAALPLPDRLPAVPVHDARRLTGGGALAAILLDGQCYTLRITKAGRLILTK